MHDYNKYYIILLQTYIVTEIVGGIWQRIYFAACGIIMYFLAAKNASIHLTAGARHESAQGGKREVSPGYLCCTNLLYVVMHGNLREDTSYWNA